MLILQLHVVRRFITGYTHFITNLYRLITNRLNASPKGDTLACI